MVVRIRLARFGRTNAPFYNIVVAQARTARNSKPMEVLGTYDPIPKPDPYDPSGKLHKDIKLDITRAKYWVGVGAQPSDTVWRLLSMLGILEPKYRPEKASSDPLAKHRNKIKAQRQSEQALFGKKKSAGMGSRAAAETVTPAGVSTSTPAVADGTTSA